MQVQENHFWRLYLFCVFVFDNNVIPNLFVKRTVRPISRNKHTGLDVDFKNTEQLM